MGLHSDGDGPCTLYLVGMSDEKALGDPTRTKIMEYGSGCGRLGIVKFVLDNDNQNFNIPLLTSLVCNPDCLHDIPVLTHSDHHSTTSSTTPGCKPPGNPSAAKPRQSQQPPNVESGTLVLSFLIA
jgi:hypothetical protein